MLGSHLKEPLAAPLPFLISPYLAAPWVPILHAPPEPLALLQSRAISTSVGWGDERVGVVGVQGRPAECGGSSSDSSQPGWAWHCP